MLLVLWISHHQLKEMINADHADPLHLLGLEQNQLLILNSKNM